MLKLNTTDAAARAGIARHTLQRWIREGQIKAPKAILRNGRAVRLWSDADIKRLENVKAATYRKGRGRKPKPKK
jgi:predicted site-specific integrase-resolvase